LCLVFFFSSRRRHTRSYGDWSSDVCSSDLRREARVRGGALGAGDGCPAAGGRGRVRRGAGPVAGGWRRHAGVGGRGVGRPALARSEERRVGKEWRCGWVAEDEQKERERAGR